MLITHEDSKHKKTTGARRRAIPRETPSATFGPQGQLKETRQEKTNRLRPG